MKERKTSKNKNVCDASMDFEITLRRYFGDSEFGTASFYNDKKWAKKKIKEIVLKIEKVVMTIDTTTSHKKKILSEIERLKEDLREKEIDSWLFVVHLFSFISRLLGFDFLKGFICNNLTYWQNTDQFYSELIFDEGDVMKDHYDKKNVILLQIKLYKNLKKEGHSDFKIAQILNTSEYQVKKLKNF